MNRLTKNNDTQYDLVGNYDTNIEEFTRNHKLRNSLLNKLGQLEDIEEELSCPLDVVFKAIMNGVYTQVYDVRLRDGDDELTYYRIVKLVKGNKLEIQYSNDCYEHYIYLEDYQKTWWLKEDRSE